MALVVALAVKTDHQLAARRDVGNLAKHKLALGASKLL